MNLTDLRVVIQWFVRDVPADSRPATLDDLIAVLEGMGAKRVWWCEEHERPGHRNACSARVKVAACPMVACLVWPLPTPEEDSDE